MSFSDCVWFAKGIAEMTSGKGGGPGLASWDFLDVSPVGLEVCSLNDQVTVSQKNPWFYVCMCVCLAVSLAVSLGMWPHISHARLGCALSPSSSVSRFTASCCLPSCLWQVSLSLSLPLCLSLSLSLSTSLSVSLSISTSLSLAVSLFCLPLPLSLSLSLSFLFLSQPQDRLSDSFMPLVIRMMMTWMLPRRVMLLTMLRTVWSKSWLLVFYSKTCPSGAVPLCMRFVLGCAFASPYNAISLGSKFWWRSLKFLQKKKLWSASLLRSTLSGLIKKPLELWKRGRCQTASLLNKNLFLSCWVSWQKKKKPLPQTATPVAL